MKGRRRPGRKIYPSELSVENSDPTENNESSEDKKDPPNELIKKRKFRLIK
jgi:hypothetical protein